MKVTSAKVKAFWQTVAAGSSDCIEWPGYRNRHGYGECRDQRFPTHLAHRVAYLMFAGPISRGKVIDHLCRNPACCNPKHMEIVHQRTNVLRGDGPSARNARATHCPQGHPYSKSNTQRTVYGGRSCKACRAAYDRLRYLRRTGRA